MFGWAPLRSGEMAAIGALEGLTRLEALSLNSIRGLTGIPACVARLPLKELTLCYCPIVSLPAAHMVGHLLFPRTLPARTFSAPMVRMVFCPVCHCVFALAAASQLQRSTITPEVQVHHHCVAAAVKRFTRCSHLFPSLPWKGHRHQLCRARAHAASPPPAPQSTHTKCKSDVES